ncbi:immunomodulatory protein [Lenzites betulinus]|nr:immunomodulatory protein [Lenzites betulinus]
MLLFLASTVKTVHIDYMPRWERGLPSHYIDCVVFPRVLKDKEYVYRVRMDDKDLGIVPSHSVATDGSQKVNLLEYNEGHGIEQTHKIQLYVIDPETQNEYLVAQWN